MNGFTIFLIWIAFMVIANYFGAKKKKEENLELPDNEEEPFFEEHEVDEEEFLDLPRTPTLSEIFSKIENQQKSQTKSNDNSEQIIKSVSANKISSKIRADKKVIQKESILDEEDFIKQTELGLVKPASRYKLKSKEDIRRALVWSEILKKKY